MRVTSFDSTSISLAWEPPPFSDRNGNIVMYNIRVREEETQTQLEYTSTIQHYTLTSLHPYYLYHISIAAVTVGTGPFTTLQHRTTQSGEAFAPLLQWNLRAMDKLGTSILSIVQRFSFFAFRGYVWTIYRQGVMSIVGRLCTRTPSQISPS